MPKAPIPEDVEIDAGAVKKRSDGLTEAILHWMRKNEPNTQDDMDVDHATLMRTVVQIARIAGMTEKEFLEFARLMFHMEKGERPSPMVTANLTTAMASRWSKGQREALLGKLREVRRHH
jgi:hypothetical protein